MSDQRETVISGVVRSYAFPGGLDVFKGPDPLMRAALSKFTGKDVEVIIRLKPRVQHLPDYIGGPRGMFTDAGPGDDR